MESPRKPAYKPLLSTPTELVMRQYDRAAVSFEKTWQDLIALSEDLQPVTPLKGWPITSEEDEANAPMFGA